ncbi:MAG: hypothetical protein BGO26_04595 [Actinobacteria bacterium 69-20]|nr:MAG: hypothetical protein BGO26_04595 [Actinobacteria bacterium 69-20]
MTEVQSSVSRTDSDGFLGNDTLLSVRNVSLRFGGIHAVDGATFDVERHSITSLIGPNGAGKTSAFNVIAGFYRGKSGSVLLNGEEIFRKPPYEIARQGLIRTFQLTRVLNRGTVLDNVLLAAQAHPGVRLRNLFFRPFASRAYERRAQDDAMDILEILNLKSHAKAYAGTLSGGQRKLLEIARALMAKPHLLLLDEPMAGINPTLGKEVFEHIRNLNASLGTTILFIEHDMGVIMRNSDRVIVMSEGRVVSQGTPMTVRHDPAVIEAYIGKRAATATGSDRVGGAAAVIARHTAPGQAVSGRAVHADLAGGN